MSGIFQLPAIYLWYLILSFAHQIVSLKWGIDVSLHTIRNNNLVRILKEYICGSKSSHPLNYLLLSLKNNRIHTRAHTSLIFSVLPQLEIECACISVCVCGSRTRARGLAIITEPGSAPYNVHLIV